MQQLPSGGQRWGAAGQGEEEQERPEQWQLQEGGGQEIPEPGGGAARDPAAAAQDPHQACSLWVMGGKLPFVLFRFVF